VFIESLILVFENWRLKTYLKRDQSIKLRNYGRHLSKAVFLVSKYPNNTTDLATAFFKSQTNSFSKYILNSTYNVCYYYNTDFSSYKKQIYVTYKQFDGATLKNDDVSLKTDDASLKIDDATLKNDDASLKIDDVTLKNDDVTLKNDDVTLKIDDVTLKIDDVSLKNDDATLKIDDITLKNDDASLKIDRLTAFPSITN